MPGPTLLLADPNPLCSVKTITESANEYVPTVRLLIASSKGFACTTTLLLLVWCWKGVLLGATAATLRFAVKQPEKVLPWSIMSRTMNVNKAGSEVAIWWVVCHFCAVGCRNVSSE